jgi:t-SNARE complex subunit (syntaxin)
MPDADRRQDILKAEEAIQQLAAELVRVKALAAEVDFIKTTLASASQALEQSRASLDSTNSAIQKSTSSSTKAVTEASEAAVRALSEAKDHLARVAGDIPRALEGVTQNLTRSARQRKLATWTLILAAAAALVSLCGLVAALIR